MWALVGVDKMSTFHPRDAMLARVIGIASVRLSVRHTPVLCQNEEMMIFSS